MPGPRLATVISLLLALAAAAASRVPVVGPLRVEIGAFDGPLRTGDWSRSRRADLAAPDARDGVTAFYFREVEANAGLRLPVVASGGAGRITVRGSARVRTRVTLFASGERACELVVRPGGWDRFSCTAALPPGVPLRIDLALAAAPLTRGAHVGETGLAVDFLEIDAPAGLRPSWATLGLVAAAVLAAFAAGALVSGSPAAGLPAALAAAVAAVVLGRAFPLALSLALPRLLPAALACGLAAHLLLRRAGGLERRDAGLLAALVALGVLFHGALVFFPNHNPPDVDIHVRRARDLAGVPLEYEALLRYGSQLPTASQDQGAATAALGERTLIPYSPLPYVAYLGVEALGVDLAWAMTVLNAALAMAVAPLMFLAAERAFGRGAGWPAALLYTLDLAVWHHLGRSHAPAVFGGALGTLALLHLVGRGERLSGRREVLLAGALLGVAALGYSSMVMLLGLFGAVLLALLLVDARGLAPPARRGVAAALVLGGLLSGILYYFHYVPGLLQGASGVEAEPDLFPGRTFLIFHNESRQALRLWVLGLWVPLLAGLAAAPFAFRRALPAARPVLLSWLAAWALLMLLKEPFLFPRLLRWAKEDQFLSPLLCLLLAGALAGVRGRGARRLSLLLVLGVALLLQLRDYAHHAVSLRL